MRIDKFLKNSRIIKRRTVAKAACESKRIKINGKMAKSSSEVNPGDIVSVEFGDKTLNVRVLSLNENAKKKDALYMYEEINE